MTFLAGLSVSASEAAESLYYLLGDEGPVVAWLVGRTRAGRETAARAAIFDAECAERARVLAAEKKRRYREVELDPRNVPSVVVVHHEGAVTREPIATAWIESPGEEA
ncbi:MAG: hypothetical protein V2A79_15545 [Planctomycetota bacterium]